MYQIIFSVIMFLLITYPVFGDEKDTRMLGLAGIIGVPFDYDGYSDLSAYPALLYMDQNFLGTAGNIMVLFVGPYINVTYHKPGMIDSKYIDGSIHWESMFLDSGFNVFEDGKARNDLYIRSPYHIISAALSKTFPVGLKAEANMKMAYKNWMTDTNKTSSDFILPLGHFTYTPGINLSIDTSGGGNGSKLDLLDGFKIIVGTEAVYQPEYQAWGKKGSLFAHDENSEWKVSMIAGYYKKIFEKQNIRLDVQFMTGGNMYKTEMWSVGKAANLMADGPSLDGFYDGEFLMTTGTLANFTYQVNFIPSKFGIYAKYDIFYNMDQSKWYHGTALGAAGKLPYDIELAGQLGVGLNAKRAQEFGYEADFLVMKMWYF